MLWFERRASILPNSGAIIMQCMDSICCGLWSCEELEKIHSRQSACLVRVLRVQRDAHVT